MVTRTDILSNWTSYFVATFLNKQYDTTLELFESIEQLLEENKDNSKEKKMSMKPFELSELYLMKARTFEA